MSIDYTFIKDVLAKVQKYSLDIEKEVNSVITNSTTIFDDLNKKNLINEIISSNRRLFSTLMQDIRNENLIPSSTGTTKTNESEESLQTQLLRARQQIQFLKTQQELKINQGTPTIITSDRSEHAMKLKEKDRMLTELQVKLQRAVQEGEVRVQNLSTKFANKYAEKEHELIMKVDELEKQNTELQKLVKTTEQLHFDLAKSRENEQKYLAINAQLQVRIDELTDKEQRLEEITKEFDKNVDELITAQAKYVELEKKYELLAKSITRDNVDREKTVEKNYKNTTH